MANTEVNQCCHLHDYLSKHSLEKLYFYLLNHTQILLLNSVKRKNSRTLQITIASNTSIWEEGFLLYLLVVNKLLNT